MWKARRKILLIVAMLMLSASVLDIYAGTSPPGPGTANSPGTYNDPNGSLTQTQAQPFMPYNGTDNAQTDTITFDVLGIETQQPKTGVVFTVATTGSLTVKFIGSQPVVTCAQCSQAYSGTTETITYAGGKSDTLTVVWSGTLVTGTESQMVLFRDDFLYTNPLIESSWTIDQYTSPGTNSGEYTSSGYLVMKATAISTETVHVTSPIYSNTSFSTGTAVKRKMTVAMIPFSKTEAGTSDLRIGISGLLSSGAYPSGGPYGTPFVDLNNNCVSNGGGNDQRGTAYLLFKNDGTVVATTCVVSGAIGNKATLESGLNPSLYTVFTVETYGIFCSTCTDNAYIGTSWTWFRAYQEDSTGKILSTTDKNINFTSGVAPLFRTSYAFISQVNSNSGATGQLSKIDFIQVQNYGSPVCLVAPAGFLCSRLPPVPSGIIGNNGLVGLIAWLANQIGFGDEQMGAIILFFAMFFGAAFMPYFFTRNIPVGAFGAMLTLGFFTYVGFLPIFTLIIVFMGGAAIVVMLVLRMLGGTSMGSFGGSDN